MTPVLFVVYHLFLLAKMKFCCYRNVIGLCPPFCLTLQEANVIVAQFKDVFEEVENSLITKRKSEVNDQFSDCESGDVKRTKKKSPS